MSAAADAVAGIVAAQHILSIVTQLGLTSSLWPRPATVQDGDCFDFIIVGGGTAGCILASRLVKLDATVLLIEGGGQPPLETMLPGTFTLTIKSRLDWNITSDFNSEAFKYHTGNVIKMQQGKVLGGSGQIDFMLYGNGIPEDYDKWAETVNDPSWKYQNMFKLIQKVEKVTDSKVLESPDIVFHGIDGKTKIRKTYTRLNEKFLGAYTEMGEKSVVDINPNNTLGYTNTYLNVYSYFRQSTAYSYLRLERKSPKLYVMYNSLVSKIILNENKTAVGVEIITENKKTIRVKAGMEVIVTAGAIKTPQLLMLSGIGPKSHLTQKKIKVVSDLPVGQNFQDRQCTVLIYETGKEDPFFVPNPFHHPGNVIMGNVALNKNQRRPDYQIISSVIPQPGFFLQACTYIYGFNYDICDYFVNALVGKYLYIVNHCLMYPKSRGEVFLNSTNPAQNPTVLPHYQNNVKDVENHANYIVHYNKIIQSTFFKSVSGNVIYPKLSKCDNIKKGTAEYWNCYIKSLPTTLGMYFGTCSMGSVVDSKLRVIGIKNLRVGDSSVIPNSVGAPIYSTTMMVAERLAELLKTAHKL